MAEPSEKGEFFEHYLKEIGVITPVRLQNTDSPPSIEARSPVDAGLSLDDLAREAAFCTACRLSETRTHVVFGTGNPAPRLVFIGEAPGKEEDARGEPFVGRAGRLLDRMLAAMALRRQDVYIMNMVKCRPPGNRDPRPDELSACRKWLDMQLKLLAPEMICILGRVAAQNLLETDAPLAALRGCWHQFRGIATRVTYHPAYLLRSPQKKKDAWKDLLAIRNKLGNP